MSKVLDILIRLLGVNEITIITVGIQIIFGDFIEVGSHNNCARAFSFDVFLNN